jgi:hypothetical protein
MDTEHKQLIKTARLTGVWYLLLAISGIVGFMILHPMIFVMSNEEQTLNNLIHLGVSSRLRLHIELVIIISQALAAVWFYKLFRDINKSASITIGIWGTVNAVVIMVSAIAMKLAIDIANTTTQTFENKEVLIELLVGLMTNAWSIGGLFFGLWLIPMGYIITTSKRMPVWLGRILMIGGSGYLIQTFIKCHGIQSPYIDTLVIPATIGEFWMIGYLLIYGIRPTNINDHK